MDSIKVNGSDMAQQEHEADFWPLLVLDDGLEYALTQLKLSVWQQGIYSQARAVLSRVLSEASDDSLSSVVCVMGGACDGIPGFLGSLEDRCGFVVDRMLMPSGKMGILMQPHYAVSLSDAESGLKCALEEAWAENGPASVLASGDLVSYIRADVRAKSGQEFLMPLECARTGIFYQGIPLAVGNLTGCQDFPISLLEDLSSAGLAHYIVLQLQSGHGVIFLCGASKVEQGGALACLLQHIAKCQGVMDNEQPWFGMQAKPIVLRAVDSKRFTVLTAITVAPSLFLPWSPHQWPTQRFQTRYRSHIAPISLKTAPLHTSPWLAHGVRCVNAMPRISYIGQVVGCEPSGVYLEVCAGGFARYPYSSDLKAKVEGLKPDHVVKMTLRRDNHVDLLGGPYWANTAIRDMGSADPE